MINGFCVNVIAVKTGPIKFDCEHQSKGGNEDNRTVKSDSKTLIPKLGPDLKLDSKDARNSQ